MKCFGVTGSFQHTCDGSACPNTAQLCHSTLQGCFEHDVGVVLGRKFLVACVLHLVSVQLGTTSGAVASCKHAESSCLSQLQPV